MGAKVQGFLRLNRWPPQILQTRRRRKAFPVSHLFSTFYRTVLFHLHMLCGNACSRDLAQFCADTSQCESTGSTRNDITIPK